jgi:hypothetical protein
MGEALVQYVVVSNKSNLEAIKQRIKGKIQYEKILRYEYIIEGLNKFKRLKIDDYVLFNNAEFLKSEINSVELARLKL